MPAKPDDSKRIAQLQEAAATLRSHERQDLADAVEFVLTGEGAQMLHRRFVRPAVTAAQPNLPFPVSPALRTRLREMAKENGTSLEAIVRDGVDRLIAGTWTPPAPTRSAYGTKEAKVNMNLRLRDQNQMRQLKDKVKELSAETGSRISAAHVAVSWLLEEFSLDANGNPIAPDGATDPT